MALNPILEAYILGRRIRQEKEETERRGILEQEKFEEEKRQAQETEKRALAFHKDMIDMQRKQFELQEAQAKFNIKNKIYENITSGILKPPTRELVAPSPNTATNLLNFDPTSEPGTFLGPPSSENISEGAMIESPVGPIDISQAVLPKEKGQLDLERALPLLSEQNKLRKEIEGIKSQAFLLRILAQESERLKREKERQAFQAEQNRLNRQSRLDAASMRGSGKNKDDEKLSPSELTTLNATSGSNLPFGTTVGEAARMGIIPRRPLSPAQEKEAAQSESIIKTLNEVEVLGNELDWKPVGYITGSAKEYWDKLINAKDEKTATFRVALNKIKADIAEMRAGKAFTANEEVLIDRYTPNIRTSKTNIKAQIIGLRKTLKDKAAKLRNPGGLTRPIGRIDLSSGDWVR